MSSSASAEQATPSATSSPAWETIATTMWETIDARYLDPGTGLYREHDPEDPARDRAFSDLWPYSGVLSAANALARLPLTPHASRLMPPAPTSTAS